MPLPCHLCLLYCCICLANFINVFNFIHVSNTSLIPTMAGSIYNSSYPTHERLFEKFPSVLWSTPYICECCFLKGKRALFIALS